MLRAEAEKLFALEHRTRQLVARVGRGEEGGHISIGFTAVASLHFVPGLLRRFNARVPGLFYSLKELSSDSQMSSLLRGEMDVALVRPPVVDSRLDARRLLSEPQVLAVPADHPLAGLLKVHVKHLHGQVLVAYERRAGRYVHDLLMRWLSEHNVVPSRYHEVVHHNALIAVVSAGLGVAVVPASVSALPIRGVVFKQFTGPSAPKIELWIASRKQAANPFTAVFLHEALDHSAQYRPRLLA